MSENSLRSVTDTYFRNKVIWGADADVWRPSRWLDGSVKSSGTNTGVWANLCAKKFLLRRFDLDLILECPLALDIVPVSGGGLREYSSLRLVFV
jgi:hypothetical protein